MFLKFILSTLLQKSFQKPANSQNFFTDKSYNMA